MSSRAFIVETTTGHVVDEVDPTYEWDAALNRPETIRYTASIEDPDEYERDWRNLATPWKHSLVVEEEGRLMGGPIVPHQYEPGQDLAFTARGMRHMMLQRRVLPPIAYAQGTVVLPTGSRTLPATRTCRDLISGRSGASSSRRPCSPRAGSSRSRCRPRAAAPATATTRVPR
ncbi:hypothetical protein Leucomu_13535 [Leucobacter muris]|uniref:Uncharacterized protein n=1 Tax=Leucobacter muris TaxID=1935379 RepID=A0ABX5QIN3_9MICO|nr:hypothetical protein [Leucobacter muris]QAB18795.1 hypothetical protein Leucomu_13535 [Leucobacter muris]